MPSFSRCSFPLELPLTACITGQGAPGAVSRLSFTDITVKLGVIPAAGMRDGFRG